MVFYYLCRDVVRGANCSYPAGRTLLYEGACRTREEAQQRADKYNRFCNVAGVFYLVVPHRDDTPFEADHYEGYQKCPYERVLIG